MKKSLNRIAQKIKLIAMDIDGVLTAGELIILDSGEEVKIWNIKDRFAFTLLRNANLGIKLMWVTARQSKQVEIRSQELKIDYLYQNQPNKLQAIKEVMIKEGIDFTAVAYIGDDLLDVPALQKVGFSVCPKDAPEEVKKAVKYVSKYCGGKGVFREVVEIIIKSYGKWSKVMRSISAAV